MAEENTDDGLYLDAEGIVRDSYIEDVYMAFYNNKIEQEHLDNLQTYVSQWFDEKIPELTMDMLTDAGQVLVWAAMFGVVTVWRLDDEKYMKANDIDLDAGLKYAAKIGAIDMGFFAAGKTLPLSIAMAVIQLCKEISLEANNEEATKGETTLH